MLYAIRDCMLKRIVRNFIVFFFVDVSGGRQIMGRGEVYVYI